MPKTRKDLLNAQILAEFCNIDPASPDPTKPGGVDYFRNNYSDFAPKAWWDEPIPDSAKAYFKDREETIGKVVEAVLQERIGQIEEKSNDIVQDLQKWSATKPLKQWQITQGYLLRWWGRKFKDDIMSLTVLLNSIFDPDPNARLLRIGEGVVRQMYPDGVPEGVTVELPGRSITSHSDLREGYIPMQAAIVYLFQNSWHARLCAECNKPFFAMTPKSKFCGDNNDECRINHRTRQKLKSRQKHAKKGWRDRICAVCKKPFVADAPRSEFCTETCRHENTKLRKREWHKENRGGGNRKRNQGKRIGRRGGR